MEYCGRSARVPLGNGQWSKFMPIAEAEQFEHNLRVQWFLKMLKGGRQVIGLRNDIPAMMDAQDLYREERGAAANNPTQAN